VRDKAQIVWITDEYELGDFGMGGPHLKRAGYVTPPSIFNASLFAERAIDWSPRAHVSEVQPDASCTSRSKPLTTTGSTSRLPPTFSGVGPTGFDRAGADVTSPTSSCVSTPTTRRPSLLSSGTPRLVAQSPEYPIVRSADRVRAAAPDLHPASEPETAP
jgi:sulfide:quinone oxidoreductase